MPFNIDERVKLSTKVLAAGVIDGFEDAQWYESRFANSFSSLASDVYGLSPTTGFAYVTNNPAPNLAAAQTAAAAAPTVIEDWTQGGVAYAGTAVQGSTAVRLTPVTGTNDVNGFSTFAAYVVYNDFSSQRLTNWIKPQSVPQASGAPSIGYSVSLYNGDPNAGGTLISTAAGQGGSPAEVGWIFNADTGLLFLAEDFRATVQDPYIVGFRYIGDTLAAVAGASPVEIIDGDGDTFVRVEELPDEDTIRISVGDNLGLRNGANVITVDAGTTTISAADSIDATTPGANLILSSGSADPVGAAAGTSVDGVVAMTGRAIFANSSFGPIRFLGGPAPVGTNGTGSPITFGAGQGDGTGRGGAINFFPGQSTGAGDVGTVNIFTAGNDGVTPSGLRFFSVGSSVGAATGSFQISAAAGMLANDQYVWPATQGNLGQVLTTDGAGILSWSNPSVNQLIDADGDTTVEVERTPDDDTIRLQSAGVDVGTITSTETTITTTSGLYDLVISDTNVLAGEPGAGSTMTIGNGTYFNGVVNNGSTVPNAGLTFVDNVTGDLNFGLATAGGMFVQTIPAGATGVTSLETRLSDGSFRASTSDTSGNFDVAGQPMIFGNTSSLTLNTPDAIAGNTASGPIDISAGISRAPFGGGAVNITGGALDASVSNVFASAGNINITGGENASNNGVAGSLLFRAGSASAGNGRGGSAFFSAGNGFGSGFGGSVTIQAGQGGATGAPGQFTFQAGNALPTSNANGGTAFIQAGNGAGSGDGGVLNISSGSNTSGTGDGGFFNFNAGIGVNGGSFEMYAGDATTGNNGNGGSFLLEAGAGDGTGDNGEILLRTEDGNRIEISDTDALGVGANYPGIVMARTVGPFSYFTGVGDATAFGGTNNTVSGWINVNNASLTSSIDNTAAVFSFNDPVTPSNNMSLGVNIFAQRIQAQLGGANAFFIEHTGAAYRSTLLAPSSTAGETHELRFEELGSTNNNYVGFKAPDVITTDTMWTLPDADGTAGQVLSTDGSGTLSWTTASGSSADSFSTWMRTGNGSGDAAINADNSADTVNIEGGRGITVAMADATDTVRFDFTRTGLGDTPVTPLDSVPMFDNSNGNLPGYRSWGDVINDLSLATALKTIFGTRAAPVAVGTAGLPLTFTNDNLAFIQGNGGPINVGGPVQIAAAGNVGDELKIIGRSDTNTVTFTNGNGLSLNGNITLGEDDIISLIWDGTNWVELSRNV